MISRMCTKQNLNKCSYCHNPNIGDYSNNKVVCPSCSHTNTNNNYILNTNKNNCPALMSDGRFITYYGSSNELTEAMRNVNGFKNPNEFRIFMQKNGDQLMNAERNHIFKENVCVPNLACSEGWHKLWTKNNGKWNYQ